MVEEQTPTPETFSAQLNVGAELQKKRRALGMRIPDISEQIRIRQDILRKLEANEFDLAAEPVYIRGFLRTYANFLGLNGAELVRELVKQEKLPSGVDVSLPTPVEEGALPTKTLIIAGLVVIILVGLAWHGIAWFSQFKEHVAQTGQQATPAVTARSENNDPAAVAIFHEGVTEDASAPLVEVAPAPPAPNGARVRLFAKEDVWVKIYDPQAEKPLFADLLKGGQHFWVPAKGLFLLDVGLPPALEVFIDGQNFGAAGVINRHVRALPLNPNYLKEGYFGKNLHLEANSAEESTQEKTGVGTNAQ